MNESEQLLKPYWESGVIKDKRDADGLHMSFSPFKVKKGLTNLQVRRRINKYYRVGNTNRSPLNCTRISLLFGDTMIFGVDYLGKRPENNRQLVKLLKNLLDICSAPKIRNRKKL